MYVYMYVYMYVCIWYVCILITLFGLLSKNKRRDLAAIVWYIHRSLNRWTEILNEKIEFSRQRRGILLPS
jgi:hypothetical protein